MIGYIQKYIDYNNLSIKLNTIKITIIEKICIYMYMQYNSIKEIEGMMNLEIWAPTILGVACETKRINMKPMFWASAIEESVY